jgi:dipeptidyl aminopeptidase/acylaminoacyl peptidase
MSATHPPLTDPLLRAALIRRASGPHSAAELIRDVRTAVETIPQGSRWAWPAVPRRRLLPALLLIAVLPALAGYLLVAGMLHRTTRGDGGQIAFVQATYVCHEVPCRRGPAWGDWITGLEAIRPRIVLSTSEADAPTPLIDVPGTRHRVHGSGREDPRSNVLSGPAVVWSPDGDRIAFRTFDDAPGIYVVNRDGSGLSRVVELARDNDSGMGWSPALAWSPDGSRIAYTYPYDGIQRPLYVVDVADGHVTRLTGYSPTGGATRVVAWSPDGSRIAFARSYSGNWTSLVVIDADGTDERELEAAERHGYHIGDLAWSPDGSRIAFERVPGPMVLGNPGPTGPPAGGLYVIAPDGSGLRRIGARDSCCPKIPRGGVRMAGDGTVRWSPDGERIARIGRAEGGGSVIIVVDADGSDERILASAYAFDWSPDGSQVVLAAGSPSFDGESGSGGVISTTNWSSIGVVDADGTDLTWLGAGEFPDWSP